MNVMNVVNTLLKNVNTITYLYQLYIYSSVILPTIFVIVLITTIYLKYFHNRRLRWVHFSIMIPLEPELRYFVSTITEFVRDYNLNAQDMFVNYNDEIKNNLYFYKTINEGVIQSRFDEAMNELEKLNVTYDSTGGNDSLDNFLNDVEKFLYTRFSWSKSEKFKRTDSNVMIVNQFYNKLKLIVDQEEGFNTFMSNSSLINFTDLDHMETDENSILNNRLFQTYGKYLPNGNLNSYITEIMTERNTPNAYNTKLLESVMASNRDFFNTQSSKTVDEEIVDTLVKMTNRVRNVFAEYYNNIIEEGNVDIPTSNPDQKCGDTTETESGSNGLIDAQIPQDLVFPDDEVQQADYARRLTIYETMNAMSTYYDEHKDDVEHIKEYFQNNYIFVEKTVYEEFDAKSHFPLFNSQTVQEILNYYHTVMDHVNVKTSIETIELATRFTIYYMLDENSRKEETLEQLVSLYIGFNDLFILERDFRKKLDAYNKSRKPEIDELKRLYNRRLSEYYTFFMEDGISKQWSELYKGKNPPRYYWTLDWLRKILGQKSFDDIIKWLFNEHKDGTSSDDMNRKIQMEVDAQFNNDLQYMSETGELQSMINEQSGGGSDEAEGEGDVVENFTSNKNTQKKVIEHFGLLGGLGNPFKELGSIIGEIFKFLKMVMKILIKLIKLITKPTEFIVFFVKIIVAFIMILFKLVFYLVKLNGSKDGVYLIGEFIAYNIVLVFTTIFNFSWFKVLFVFTYIIMVLDLYVFKGSLYSFLYWLFGATENSPRAWYMRTGYHYGQDTCKSETCDNNFQNKAKRMFFAFNACGDNYKPDRGSAGLMCARKLTQEPGFCLNANIERVRQGLPVKTPIIPGEFFPSNEFLDATKMKRRRMINDFKKMKANFYNNCENTMKNYNDLTKNICRMYAGVVATDSERRKLEALCYNTYCSNGIREQFCYKYTKPNSQDLISTQPGKGGAVMYKNVAVGSLYILIVSFLVNQMLLSIPTVPSPPPTGS